MSFEEFIAFELEKLIGFLWNNSFFEYRFCVYIVKMNLIWVSAVKSLMVFYLTARKIYWVWIFAKKIYRVWPGKIYLVLICRLEKCIGFDYKFGIFIEFMR